MEGYSELEMSRPSTRLSTHSQLRPLSVAFAGINNEPVIAVDLTHYVPPVVTVKPEIIPLKFEDVVKSPDVVILASKRPSRQWKNV